MTAADQGIDRIQEGGVLRLCFNRPARRNAISARMYLALVEGLGAAAAATDVRVVVLHGQPGVFTAGNDLKDFLENPPDGEDAPAHRFLSAIRQFPKPLIAAVSGPAVGIGTTLLLHCDVVYAADDASFSLPFCSLGLCPEAASSLLLPALAGYARAAEKLLFGEPFDAAQAQDMGLVNRIVAADSLLEFALDRARLLAKQPAASLLETKRLMRAPLADQVARAMVDENRTFRRMLAEPPAREAFRAFLEKRRPRFDASDAATG